ncbi:MAG: hypothetical protein ABW157_06595 [Candidatus Thiodiazotropha sp. LLP2]
MNAFSAKSISDRLKTIGLDLEIYDKPFTNRSYTFADFDGFSKFVSMPRLKDAQPSSLPEIIEKYGSIKEVPIPVLINYIARNVLGIEKGIDTEVREYIDVILRGAHNVTLYIGKNITVTKDNPLIIDHGHAFATYGTVTVKDDGYIEIRTNTVFTALVIRGETSESLFRVYGVSGTDGEHGKQGVQGTPGINGTDGTCSSCGIRGADGSEGSDGGNGGQGTDGKNGENGKNAPTVAINIGDLQLDASVVLCGGNGGNGGVGGHGGNGGRGGNGGLYQTCSAEHTGGGDGGKGGNGSNGGNGGNGGSGGDGSTVIVHYKSKSGHDLIGNVLTSTGGKGGTGGVVGAGGPGGKSGGNGSKSGASGNAGSINGRTGNNGNAGSGGHIEINPAIAS